MKRVAGCDANSLYEETAVQHMHTIKVAMLDPATAPHAYSFERLRGYLIGQAVRLPPLRWRLVRVPLSLFLPFWADQASIDPAKHIQRITAPPPGNLQGLCAIVSRIASTPLDLTQPLWQVWIVEGLARGHIALVCKIHHALADGVASVQLLRDLLSGQAGLVPAQDDEVPGSLMLAIRSIPPLLWMLTAVPVFLVLALQGIAVSLWRRRRHHPMLPTAFSGPSTRFNLPLTANREYACTTVALDDVKAIKEAFGCTLNDVVLAIAGGAVRAYLERAGELPHESLTAIVPVSLWGNLAVQNQGNRLAHLVTSLHTNVADPAARLRAVQETTQEAKRRHDARGRRFWQAWWACVPLVNLLLRIARWLTGLCTHRPPYNLIVSNVRGPALPLSCDGARVVALHSMGPIASKLGLNITAWSYHDGLSFGVVACPEHLPGVDLAGAGAWELADRISEQVVALRQAADTLRTSGFPA